MRKPSKTTGATGKTRRRKAAKLKPRDALRAASRRSSIASQDTDLSRLSRELNEALEQQTVTSEVLQVISSSPGDLEPVLATILEKAVRVCDAKFGSIYRWDGDTFRLAATYNLPPAYAEVRTRLRPFHPSPQSFFGRIVASKKLVQFTDLAAERDYAERNSATVAVVELGGVRTLLAAPILKEDKLIAVLSLARQEVRPFTEKQIALLSSFTSQAAIAIENTRLLNELRQRTDELTQRTTDLTEALEQQTATSEVLQVINASPGDLAPVFDAMVEKAMRLCAAAFGGLWTRWRLRPARRHEQPAFSV